MAVDYCASGTITATEGGGRRAHRSTFDMGELFVCDTTLEHTAENDAAFQQDDTPTDFHGDFVSFVSGAAEAAAAAVACPADQLEQFRTPDFTALRDASGWPTSSACPAADIDVVAPTMGASDEDTRAALDERLDSFLERRDPDDPDHDLRGAVDPVPERRGHGGEDSCYRDPGATELDDINDVGLPE